MKYIITGRVQPERADIFFQEVQMGLGGNSKATIACGSSQLTVIIEKDDIDGWQSAAVLAEDISAVVVSSLGFSLSSGYSVDIIQVIDEANKPYGLGVRPLNPMSEKGDESLGFGDEYIEVFNRSLRLAASDLFYRLAIQDYLHAINRVRDCATYCYRAIESIKSSYELSSKGKGWNEMHLELGTNRDEIIDTIKNYADPVRHGNWVQAKPTDNVIRWKMLSLTKRVLLGYLDAKQKDF